MYIVVRILLFLFYCWMISSFCWFYSCVFSIHPIRSSWRYYQIWLFHSFSCTFYRPYWFSFCLCWKKKIFCWKMKTFFPSSLSEDSLLFFLLLLLLFFLSFFFFFSISFISKESLRALDFLDVLMGDVNPGISIDLLR